MPYISKDNGRREALRNGDTALNAGELNYQIFYHVKHMDWSTSEGRLKTEDQVKNFVKQFLGDKPNYQKYNDMSGVCIRCNKEIQRRLGIDTKFLLNLMNSYDKEIEKYEDIKCSENGDVE